MKYINGWQSPLSILLWVLIIFVILLSVALIVDTFKSKENKSKKKETVDYKAVCTTLKGEEICFQSGFNNVLKVVPLRDFQNHIDGVEVTTQNSETNSNEIKEFYFENKTNKNLELTEVYKVEKISD